MMRAPLGLNFIDRIFYELADQNAQTMAGNKEITKGNFDLNFILKPNPLLPLHEFLPEKLIDTKGKTGKAVKRVIKTTFDEIKRDYAIAHGPKVGIDHATTEWLSWYNEVAISPQTQKGGSVKIVGIFIRGDIKSIETTLKRKEAIELFKIAEAFDLPVVHIIDGQEYDLGFGF